MSVQQVPASDPARAEPIPTVLVAAMLLLAIVMGAVLYERWLMRSDLLAAVNELMLHDSRVRAEFGNDVRLRAALAWKIHGEATVVAYVRGAEAYGFAFLQLDQKGNGWIVAQGEIRNVTEDHILSLTPVTAIAPVGQLHGNGRLYLVALGLSAATEVEELAQFLQEECGVRAEVLPPMELPEAGRDPKRKQWIAEMLVDAMAEKFPRIAGDEDARIMGVIDDDMYIRDFQWPFSFSYRFAQKYAVLQTARLDPAFSGRRSSPAIRMQRLRTTAMKCLGMLYFGFQESRNSQSVMSFESSVRSLDEAGGHYLLSDVATQPKNDYIPGNPCLTFSAANVAGLPRLEPIGPCFEPYDLSGTSYFQVDLSRGEFRTERNDVYRTGPLPFVLRRMYASHIYDGKVRAFGKSTWQNLDDTVWSIDSRNMPTISVYGVEFKRITPGVGFSPDAKYVASENSGEFSGAVLTWEGRWKIEARNGAVWHYRGCDPNSRIPCYFMDRTSAAGDRIAVERDGDGHIQRALQTATGGLPTSYDHTWTFAYDGDRVRTIDGDGQSTQYSYDADSYLKEVRTGGRLLRYDYDDAHRMNRVAEDGQEVGLHYDKEGRVTEIDFSTRVAYRIAYSGETVEVSASGQTYTLKMRGTFFQLTHQP